MVQNDRISICHRVDAESHHTLTINDNAWPAHQDHGDVLGACTAEEEEEEEESPPASSAASSVAASSAASSAGTATCADRFSVAADGTITTTGPLSIQFDSLGAQFGYGNGGPTVPVKVAYKKTSNGNSWTNLFSGNAINGTGGASQTVSGFTTGNKVILRYHASFSSRGWLSYDRKIYSNDGSSNIMVLRNGDTAPVVTTSNGQTSISTLLQSITANGVISIGTYDAVLVGDFNRQDCNSCSNNFCSNCTGVDYQDGVVLVKFLTPSC